MAVAAVGTHGYKCAQRKWVAAISASSSSSFAYSSSSKIPQFVHRILQLCGRFIFAHQMTLRCALEVLLARATNVRHVLNIVDDATRDTSGHPAGWELEKLVEQLVTVCDWGTTPQSVAGRAMLDATALTQWEWVRETIRTASTTGSSNLSCSSRVAAQAAWHIVFDMDSILDTLKIDTRKWEYKPLTNVDLIDRIQKLLTLRFPETTLTCARGLYWHGVQQLLIIVADQEHGDAADKQHYQRRIAELQAEWIRQMLASGCASVFSPIRLSIDTVLAETVFVHMNIHGPPMVGLRNLILDYSAVLPGHQVVIERLRQSIGLPLAL